MSIATAGPPIRTGGSLGDPFVTHSAQGSQVVYKNVDDPVLRALLPNWDFVLSFDALELAAEPEIPESKVASETRTKLVPLEAFVGKAWLVVDSEPKLRTAYNTVNEISAMLGVPVHDVLKGTGIRRRTYHSWAHTEVNPRISSQGALWRLLRVCDDLNEVLEGDVSEWFRSEERNREILREGGFDELLASAYAYRSRRQPPTDPSGPSSAVGSEEHMPHLAERRVPQRTANLRSRSALSRD